LRLSPHPARAGPSGLITRGRTIRSGRELGSSAGPLTATVAAVSSLSVGWGVVVTVIFGVHLTTSARFRARALGPVSGRLIHVHQQEGADLRVVGSRRVSAAGVRFLVILCPPRSWALLTVGLPDLGPDLDGVSVFHTHELRSGWVPSLLRGQRCSPWPESLTGQRLPHHSGLSLNPATSFHLCRALL